MYRNDFNIPIFEMFDLLLLIFSKTYVQESSISRFVTCILSTEKTINLLPHFITSISQMFILKDFLKICFQKLVDEGQKA